MPFTLNKMGTAQVDARGYVNVFYIQMTRDTDYFEIKHRL